MTDNEKTVSLDHIARIPVRNLELVEVARHYGLTIRTCIPADPQTKGGSEATVRIAKADLVPTTTNLLDEYRTFGELEAACRAFCFEVNDRPHRETRRRPAEVLAENAPDCTRCRSGRSPSRSAPPGGWDATISVEGVRYSVPHELVDTRIWARFHGDELIVTAVGEAGPVEVARHARSTPGSPVISDEHYPPREDKGVSGPRRPPPPRRPRSWPSDRARRVG